MKMYSLIIFIIGFGFNVLADGTNLQIQQPVNGVLSPTNYIDNTPTNLTYFFSTNIYWKQYNSVFVAKITDKWFNILDKTNYPPTPTAGKVVVIFYTFPDGHVADLKIDKSDVEEGRIDICKMAITNSAPFDSWTKEMRQAYTNDSRKVVFTFSYYN